MSTSLAGSGLTKQYGATRALDGVDLAIRTGSIHALVGENGAGKSTLTKLLAGLEQPSSGELRIDGEPVAFTSRTQALRHGIGLVPQQSSLNPELTLVENLALSGESLLVRRGAGERRLREVAERTGLTIHPRRKVGELALAEQQFAELALALAAGARFLLLDEPTSALGPFETRGLFTQLRALADAGTGILLITHRIDEVRLVADDVTVLRHGRLVHHSPVADVTDDALVHALVGSVPPPPNRAARTAGAVSFRIEGASVASATGQSLRDISIELRAGEVVGVVGVAGNGQRELARLAAGELRPDSGSVSIDGAEIGGRPAEAFARGVRYVPEERIQGLLPDQSLSRSVALVNLTYREAVSRFGVVWPAITRATEELIERHDVRPPRPSHRAVELSGGNQQKLLVGRELAGDPRVVIVHGPTQGLDLHAAAAIRDALVAAAAKGAAVLLISADTDEVHELADRVVVLAKGRVSDEFPIAEFDHGRLGRAMAGLTLSAAS